MSDDPNSVAEWLQLSRDHELSAQLLNDNRKVANQGYFHTGMAVEAAVKAYIMHVQRLNAWPSREEYRTHSVRKLIAIAGIAIVPTDPKAPSWHVVLQWNRQQGYDPRRMPRKVARSLFKAAFGPDGVVTWIRSILT